MGIYPRDTREKHKMETVNAEAMLDYPQDVIKNQWGVSGFRKTILRFPIQSNDACRGRGGEGRSTKKRIQCQGAIREWFLLG